MQTSRLVPMAIFSVIIAATVSPSSLLAAPSQVQDTSRHLYDRVMEEFKHRDYEAALAGFRLFLGAPRSNLPGGERTVLGRGMPISHGTV